MAGEIPGNVPPPDSRPSKKRLPGWKEAVGLLVLTTMMASCTPAVAKTIPPETQTAQAATWEVPEMPTLAFPNEPEVFDPATVGVSVPIELSQSINLWVSSLLLSETKPETLSFIEADMLSITEGEFHVPPGHIQLEIREGDTLWSIAATFGTNHEALAALNRVDPRGLQVGELLIVPINGEASGDRFTSQIVARSSVEIPAGLVVEMDLLKQDEVPVDLGLVFELENPRSLSEIAILLGITEADILAANPFFNSHDPSDGPCPFYSDSPMILCGRSFIRIPKEISVKVGNTEAVSLAGLSGSWHGVIASGTKGRLFNEEEEISPLRAVLMGVNPINGKLIIKLDQGGDYFEIPQERFIVDHGLVPTVINDERYGEGFRWQTNSLGDSIGIEIYERGQWASQNMFLSIAHILPFINEITGMELANIDRIIISTQTPDTPSGVSNGFWGIIHEENGSFSMHIGLNIGAGGYDHELAHGGNQVRLKDGTWVSAYSPILNEAIATYVENVTYYARWGQWSEGQLISEDSMQIKNLPELRGQPLMLDFSDRDILNNYGVLSRCAGRALLEIDQVALDNGRPEFLQQLLQASKHLTRIEEKQVSAEDWLVLAEQIWPGQGPELINRYHVLFMR
ncbi:LysM peptidoglycan-binding domain-containing protein [Patescibacteria group bacterium]|nr:LysM peptidoglycan-binding domain-containing protein [Patescibacteria group bacterium]MBU1931352.1 LysM peptidoglycan-binding domain-containing protein [Patescibacteria group bacterium]